MPRRARELPLVSAIAVLVLANFVVNVWAPRATQIAGPVFAVVCIVIARWDGCSWDDLGLARGTFGRGLRWALLGAALLAAAYAVALAWAPTRQLFNDRRTAVPTATLWYEGLVRVPLGTVLLEEVAFRGMLLGMGVRRWGRTAGICFSSALFGLWHLLASRGVRTSNHVVAAHFGSGAGAVAGWLVMAVLLTAAGGAALCWIRLRSRSLLSTIGLHWATNALAYLGAGLVRTGFSAAR